LRFNSLKKGFHKADCVLMLNNNNSYKNLDIFPLLESMEKPGLFFDAWHIFNEILINPIPGVVYRGI
jgi:UDP-N-acetyl-D-mannosaminuronic acid dehydrogenase